MKLTDGKLNRAINFEIDQLQRINAQIIEAGQETAASLDVMLLRNLVADYGSHARRFTRLAMARATRSITFPPASEAPPQTSGGNR